MSTLKVNFLTNKHLDGSPLFTKGLTVASGYALTCSGGVNITGIVTATSFSGDGSNLVNLTVINAGKAVAIKYILDPLPFYRH